MWNEDYDSIIDPSERLNNIKELILKLPEGENVDFKAGGYVQLEAPAYEIDYKSFDIQKEYHGDWDHFKIWDNKAINTEPVIRTYSMANYPEEKGIIKFNIRIASPPPGTDFPPGVMSSWTFNLKPGDKVIVSGPYGEFFIKILTGKWFILVVVLGWLL